VYICELHKCADCGEFFRQDGLWARDLTKRNMKQVYDDSGYTWCDADKKEELIEHGGAARFLIARKKRTGG
jgi:hypothetical protein